MKDVDWWFLGMCLLGHRGPVLALGRHSSEVLKRLNITHHVLPHPSPRNRVWNDKGAEERVLKECEAYLNT